MRELNIKIGKRVVPMCYAYTTPEIKRHDGWIKIGFTEQDVHTRIRQQTQTAGVKYNLEWQDNAIYADGSGETFHNTDFHGYLQKIGTKREPNTEWFEIGPKESHDEFDHFRRTRGLLETSSSIPYKLREEQERAVEQTKDYFNANEEYAPEFLWNAKPRFGKTLSAYDLCKTIDAKKVLIVTNRPAIANSWYSDYVKFLGTEAGYAFVSNVDALKDKPFVYTREKYLDLPNKPRGFIEFVSLQDMKGSIYFGGRYNKLQEVSELNWDLLIIDEAHEGVDTYKTDVAFDHVKRKYTLHLSGTPFKALAREKFEDKAIFYWTYADEQQAKRDWDGEGENPYGELPQLNLYTYQMSEIVESKVRQGEDFNDDGKNEEYAFDLNEFFETNSDGTFKYDESVDKFLEALTTQTKFPFSTEELRNELKHTFWILNRVDSAKALARKLTEHPVFKDYKIVLVAGDGKLDSEEETKKSYDKVIEAISKNDKTITISVGQLTTGITVPEWTAVLILSNMKSPALYMQAAFRAQNLCLFNNKGVYFRKENAYVFDFDPARTLEIFEEFANDLTSDTSRGKGDASTRKKHIRELLNFFPVYGEDSDGEMIELDAEKVLSIPRKIHAVEVVRRGFMSNFLFQNIGNIFNAPQEVIEIVKKFEPLKEPVPIKPETKDDLSLDENGEVNLQDTYVVGQATELFGEKMYKVAENLQTAVENIEKTKKTDEDITLEKLKEEFKETVTNPLIEEAKEKYGKDMTQSTKNTVAREIASNANTIIEKHFGDYKINQNTIAANEQKEIAQLKQEGKTIEIKKVEAKYTKLKEEAKKEFYAKIQNKADELVQSAGNTIVKAVETDKKQKEKKGIEDSVRDHLRGFSRTIPSFLMAYGTRETTLENFDKIIPAEVFKDVTSITLDEFRFLRDGGDYKDEETGETKHFDGRLFDPIVFNDSVQEFLNLKEKLADYFDESHTEDIFDYIPPQKTNQIFTPKKVVREMVKNLEEESPECFDDPNKTFIDLYMKSGLYITEIVKKLYNSPAMKKVFPRENDRLKHIFGYQVYGLAPTEIIYKIATAYILGFADKDKIENHNLRCFDTLPSVQNGTLEKDLDKLFPKQDISQAETKEEHKGILKRFWKKN